MGGKRISYSVGDTIRHLTIVSVVEGIKPTKYICRCDCGNVKEVWKHNLGKQQTVSCGCYKQRITQERNNRLADGESAFNYLVGQYKRPAHGKIKQFEITTEYFRELVTSNCHYCGRPPQKRAYRALCKGPFHFNGIDRVDNTKDYIPGNVVSCCYVCNRAKNNMGYDDFIQYLNDLVKYRWEKPE